MAFVIVNVSRFYSQSHTLLDNASDETRLTIFSGDLDYSMLHVNTVSHKSDNSDHTDVHLNAAVINRVNSYSNLINKGTRMLFTYRVELLQLLFFY